MISMKIENMLNQQLAHELTNASKYRVMKSWLKKQGYEGLASFYDKNYKDELNHADWVQKFIEDRNGDVDIPSIDGVCYEYSTVKEIAEMTLVTEVDTTEMLKGIYTEAFKENDLMTCEFIMFMLKEQIEEEDKSQTFVDLATKATDECSILMLDEKYED